MARLSHGAVILLHQVDGEPTYVENVHGFIALNPHHVPCPQLTNYGYLFDRLSDDPANRLPELCHTAENLIALGNTMKDYDPLNPEFDSAIPSVYTYFGQFISHDVTLEGVTRVRQLNADTQPIVSADCIEATLKNTRSAKLDLDSVYGPRVEQDGCHLVPRKLNAADEMKVARAYKTSVEGTDLPRDLEKNSAPLIGDPRNDENLILSQLHLAFLRAHNILVSEGASFQQAQTLMRKRYQWIVTHDFLDRIADPVIVNDVRTGAGDIFPANRGFFMPLEFSSAAFRFGHSMVRPIYNYNKNFSTAALIQLIMPGAMGNYFHITEEWIMSWEPFIQNNRARLINTKLVDPIPTHAPNGTPLLGLAALDLLRGYLLRLPTGEAVARTLNLHVLTAAEIEAVAANDEQRKLLSSNFAKRTPLWFYILAEAAHFNGGQRLGPVGSTLVAGVLMRLARESDDYDPAWTPTLSEDGRFDLPQLLQLAQAAN